MTTGRVTPVRLRFAEDRGLAREGQPVTFGVPFPPGGLDDPARLRLAGPDGALPLQAAVTARWRDGSVKWALLDTQVSLGAGAEVTLSLEAAEAASPGPEPMPLTRDGGDLEVDTGAARFRVGPGSGLPVWRSPDGPVAGALVLTDRDGRTRPGRVTGVAVTAHGPVRTSLRCTGEFGGTGLRFIAEVSCFAASAAVALRVTLHNPRRARHPGGLWDLGDPGSVLFRGLAWRCSPGGPVRARWRALPDGPVGEGAAARVYQESSGGARWDSRNHVNRDGEVPLVLRGYRVTVDGAAAGTGERAQPTLWAVGPAASVAATLEEFWQRFPKALAVDGGELAVELFPADFPDLHELQGGERTTHAVWLACGTGAAPADPAPWACPLFPVLAPETVAATGVVPWLAPLDPEAEAGWQALAAEAVDPERGFAARREVIDEYGWRNFGDLYADHEAVHYTGPPPVISHYNNQYDAVFGMLVQHLRTGDPRWFRLARDLVRHVADIDVYHTTEDRAAFNGGLFWHTDHYEDAGTCTHRTYGRKAAAGKAVPRAYGGGPANEHIYTSGLLLWHHLTGDPLAAEAARGLADWVIAMDDGRRTPLGWVDAGPTGNASRTATPGYHGPGRGAGNAINALLDGYLITGEGAYLEKAEGLVARVAHPAEDVAARGLDDPERRWSYVVFLQVLGRYLHLKAEWGQLDRAYAYGRAVLLRYARWMADHEGLYLDRPEKLEFPTETWAAQEIRKAHVFDLAARAAEGGERERFAERAGFFFRATVEGLAKWETRTLTRPLVILLAAAWPHAHFLRHPEAVLPAPDPGVATDFGAPVPFVSQRTRVRERLRRPAGWAALLLGLVRNGPARLGERLKRGAP